MNPKKIAVMIYPYFSMQEISCLTSCLTVWYEREIDMGEDHYSEFMREYNQLFKEL